MANTTNFNWETPDDTDLVKDGAAAIRTLGNGIDTSFVDLKGGSSGQVLSKASNTDLDFTWIAGGGKLIQVVQGLKTDSTTTTSQSFIATGVTLTITPTANTSKILIMSTINVAGDSNTQPMYKLRRNNTTDLFVGDAAGNRPQVSGQTFTSNSNYAATGNLIYLDSPATTSATTYEIYWRAEAASTVALNRTVTDNNTTGYGVRSASSIIAIEIGA
jgi:hypothetical protein